MVTASAITEPRRDGAEVELLKVRSGVAVVVRGRGGVRFRSDVLCALPAYTAEKRRRRRGGESAMTMGQQKEAAGKGGVINKHPGKDILEEPGAQRKMSVLSEGENQSWKLLMHISP